MNQKKNSMPASASLEMPTPLRGFSPTHPVLPGAGSPGAKMLPVPEKTEVYDASNTPRKTNMSPENQWLEDVFPIEIVPF